MIRANKIFINENNRCVILDSQNLLENIQNSTMRMSQRLSQKPSVSQSISNLKASNFIQNNGSLTFLNKKKLENVEKILTEGSDVEKLNILNFSNVIERNEKWLEEKIKNKKIMKKKLEAEEIKDCSFAPTFFSKGFRASSYSRISTVVRKSEFSPFSSHRSIISNQNQIQNNVKTKNANKNQSALESRYEKFKIKGNNVGSKWYFHDSYQKEYERKRDFSQKKGEEIQ